MITEAIGSGVGDVAPIAAVTDVPRRSPFLAAVVTSAGTVDDIPEVREVM